MEVTVFNPDLESIGIIDAFESLIWTDRYYGIGDFELVKSPSVDFIQLLNQGVYLGLKESEHLMVIEYINIKSDPVNGNKIIVKGRSIESILDRRIIWDPINLIDDNINGFQNSIYQLIDCNAITTPSIPERKIHLLEFEMVADPTIWSLTDVNTQFHGESLYSAVYDLCVSRGVGFKIILSDYGKFVFKLYAGADRTYDQLDNPCVVFSPNYENLINGDYISSSQMLRTIALVAGEEGVGNARRTKTVDISAGAATDLDRRELFTDAKGISRTVPNEEPLTDAEYDSLLEQKGIEDLAKNTLIQSFEGQVDASLMTYGVDYFMGDILQVADEYGNEAKSRVIELIHSQDSSGIRIYPTFSIP
jgi:hypothetical protein